MEKWTEFIRAIVRPILAVAIIGGLLGLYFGHYEIDKAYWTLAGSITTFYFLSREKK